MLYLIRTPPRHSPKVQGRFSLSIHVFKAYFRLLSSYPYIYFKPNSPLCKPYYKAFETISAK